MNTILTFISLIVLTSHLASSVTMQLSPTIATEPAPAKTTVPTPSLPTPVPSKTEVVSNDVKTQVSHLSQKAPSLNKNVLKMALLAYKKAHNNGAVKKPVLTVIDYTLPSWKQRMWIFNLKTEQLLYYTHVAHGKNSGMDVPHHFSNQTSSKATSLGTYVTRDTYFGSKGYSLNLQGLEKGFNDNAYNRRVVVHGAWYMEPSFIQKTGRAGRSWGCPSIAKTIAKPVINLIKGGSVLFAYYPDHKYLSKSGFAVA